MSMTMRRRDIYMSFIDFSKTNLSHLLTSGIQNPTTESDSSHSLHLSTKINKQKPISSSTKTCKYSQPIKMIPTSELTSKTPPHSMKVLAQIKLSIKYDSSRNSYFLTSFTKKIHSLSLKSITSKNNFNFKSIKLLNKVNPIFKEKK